MFVQPRRCQLHRQISFALSMSFRSPVDRPACLRKACRRSLLFNSGLRTAPCRPESWRGPVARLPARPRQFVHGGEARQLGGRATGSFPCTRRRATTTLFDATAADRQVPRQDGLAARA